MEYLRRNGKRFLGFVSWVFWVAWAGLAPGVHQSGDKTVQGRITRRGNRLVRWVLVQAAQVARLHDERFREFYERNARRKGDKKAVVAIAHEMLRIVWFMLKRSEAYRGETPDFHLRCKTFMRS